MSPQAGRTAQTAPNDADARLRGRTYAVPFDQVWQAAVALAGGALRGWKIVEQDDYEGIIKAESWPLIGQSATDVRILISLDENAQTRVDLQTQARSGWPDLGAKARRIGKFCRKLDERLTQARGRPVSTL